MTHTKGNFDQIRNTTRNLLLSFNHQGIWHMMHQEAMTRSNQLYCTHNNRGVYFQIDFPANFECQQKSYKSAIKNRRLEKSIPDVLIAFTSKKLSYYLCASLQNGDSIFAGKCAQNDAKNNFICENGILMHDYVGAIKLNNLLFRVGAGEVFKICNSFI